MIVANLTVTRTLQDEAAALVDKLDTLSETAPAGVRQQLKHLSAKAWQRYQRRTVGVSQQITTIWGDA